MILCEQFDVGSAVEQGLAPPCPGRTGGGGSDEGLLLEQDH